MQAVDSHCHVFDPSRFSFSTDAAYTPAPHEIGTAEHFLAVLDAHGLSHALLVAPSSGYNYDNRYLLEAIRSSNGRFKGIARVRPDITALELGALHEAGVIGVRIDLIGDGVEVMRHASMPRLLGQLRERGALVQVQCERDQLAEALPMLRNSKVRLIVDHCGRPDPALGMAQKGFQALIELGREGHAVKLSGPFRFSKLGVPYEDADPFIAALLGSFTPDRCVWGSDWPFLRIPARLDYGPVLGCLARWLSNEADRRKVLWATPARLFGLA